MRRSITKKQLFNLCLLTIIICCTSCDEEEVVFTSPSIQIESALATTLSTYEAIVKLDIGEGQLVQKAEIVFEDITVFSNPDIIRNIGLTGKQNQIDTITLTTTQMNHDYSVYARIQTEAYIYESNSIVIRSLKNKFELSVYPDNMYSDLSNNIADALNKGDFFTIGVDYDNVYKPKTVKVKLNGEIEMNHNLNFENYRTGDNITTGGSVFVPEDLEEGIYSVHVYLDGIEFKTKHDIKVLKGRWATIDPGYMGGRRGEYASFVNGDDLYLIGGEFYVTQLNESPVWKYNIKDNTWLQKNNFPHPGDVTRNRIFPFNLQYNNQAYIVLKNDKSIEIWKYQEQDDEWSFVTNYPGKSILNFTSFIVDGKLYLGGGFRLKDNTMHESYEHTNEFWAYNLVADEWKQKKNIPIKIYGYKGNLSCITEKNNVFVFSYANELWQYYPDGDNWIIKKKFPGPRRYISNLVSKDEKIYLMAGSYIDMGLYGLKDCWEYSNKTDQWELVAFLPEFCAHGIAFTYGDHIYTGLGWVVHGYGGFDEQNFYRLEL